jgi:hypothetical protein
MDSCWKYPGCYGQEMRLLPLLVMSRFKTQKKGQISETPTFRTQDVLNRWPKPVPLFLYAFKAICLSYEFLRLELTGVFTLYIAGKARTYSFYPSAKINPPITVRWISWQMELEELEGGWILHETFVKFNPLKPSGYYMNYMYPQV